MRQGNNVARAGFQLLDLVKNMRESKIAVELVVIISPLFV